MKLKPRKMDSKFMWQPKGIFNTGIGPMEFAIYGALADHADNDTQMAWPSRARIAKLTKMSVASVSRGLRVLEKKGLIYTKRMKSAANRYMLLDQSHWKTETPTVDEDGQDF